MGIRMGIKEKLRHLEKDLNELYLKHVNHEERIEIIKDNQNRLLSNQKILFDMIKKLADAHQFEYKDGNYISKRGKGKSKQ